MDVNVKQKDEWFELEVQRLTLLLKQSEMNCKKQQLLYDKNMEYLEQKMIDFETCLQKEQLDIQTLLKQKDQQILLHQDLARSLLGKLNSRFCKHCENIESKSNCQVDLEVKKDDDELSTKILPPLSLPLASSLRNLSFMSNHHFRQPKSKLSPVAEESEVMFTTNLRSVHADLNPERFHAALSASLQSLVNEDNNSDSDGNSPMLIIPTNTSEFLTPEILEAPEYVLEEYLQLLKPCKKLNVATQTHECYLNGVQRNDMVIPMTLDDFIDGTTEDFVIGKLGCADSSNYLNTFCDELSQMTISLAKHEVNETQRECYKPKKKSGTSNLFSNSKAIDSMQSFCLHLTTVIFNEAKQAIISMSPPLFCSASQDTTEAKLFDLISEVVENVIPTVSISSVAKLVKQGIYGIENDDLSDNMVHLIHTNNSASTMLKDVETQLFENDNRFVKADEGRRESMNSETEEMVDIYVKNILEKVSLSFAMNNQDCSNIIKKSSEQSDSATGSNSNIFQEINNSLTNEFLLVTKKHKETVTFVENIANCVNNSVSKLKSSNEESNVSDQDAVECHYANNLSSGLALSKTDSFTTVSMDRDQESQIFQSVDFNLSSVSKCEESVLDSLVDNILEEVSDSISVMPNTSTVLNQESGVHHLNGKKKKKKKKKKRKRRSASEQSTDGEAQDELNH